MLRLLHDRVLIKRMELPTQTKGGIILPLKAVELPQLGYIKYLGSKNPDQLVVGDKVLLKKFEGQRLYVYGEELYMFFLEDLLAVIR